MLGIYVHIPFCVKKCNYCDFVSVSDPADIKPYLSALKKEMGMISDMYSEKVDSVFIGGGTPGMLRGGEIANILTELRTQFEVTNDAEISIETNPCVVTKEKLDEYIGAGVNRVSIGLQAGQNSLLSFLGRRHTVAEFDQAFSLAREAGFLNINADVIYAVPGQTLKDWKETLNHLLYLKPEHISAYALKIEENTVLGQLAQSGEIAPVDEDLDADMYELTQSLLAEKGYVNYEVSNFAFAGRECQHNLKYWTLQDYLGVGVASHSCIGNLRFENTTDIKKYIQNISDGRQRYAQSKLISEKERKYEYIMLCLRLKEGFAHSEYRRLFRENFCEVFYKELQSAYEYGLLEKDEDRVLPSKKGFALQNFLVQTITQNM